jgi:hypothetical protein
MSYRELGKLPRAAPDGAILQLGGHGYEPWLSVDDRCEAAMCCQTEASAWRWLRRGVAGDARTGNPVAFRLGSVQHDGS